MSLVPKKVFFVRGKGFHKSKLAAFEEALRDAGIEKYNLVNVSSILPPYCIEVDRENGLDQLRPGQIIYAVIARADSNEYNRLICASIGVAKPADIGHYGYLSEHHSFGIKPENVGDFAEDLAAEMLATTLGIPFDPEANYDEKREVFRMEGKIVETKNITSSATVRNENEWASVVAAAIFIL
ncbi:MAG: pyruvoyl-dependent arginine decarboxylase [Candidatus Hodarchaeota archaeon]